MRKELIKISEFQRRKWGENGTPLCSQAIRNHLRNRKIPGERVGNIWYVDWAAYQRLTGNNLVDMVLKGWRDGSSTRNKANKAYHEPVL